MRKDDALTPEQFAEMAAAQGHTCGCCEQPADRLFVDVHPEDGAVRSLVCGQCAYMLEAFPTPDMLRRAADILASGYRPRVTTH